ncbi:MAG TPA: phosphoribosylaminoimidazolesuccinocarboxamide synthase [Woeseiaceae bacterium]|nr:phosphoribosylaminoimidazolesuccinocarboxamide synthase [Woeseiaceae bacterium]
MSTSEPMFESRVPSLPLLGRGKVRDIYAVGDEHILIVTTDRLSAYDVVLPDPVPDKGRVLNELSNFWFTRLADLVPNHVANHSLESVVGDPELRRMLASRSIVARRLKPLPIEAIVRGYLIGSGWRDYRASGAVCGIALPPGLRQADRLPQPLFTPATKAVAGEHDENVSFERVIDMLGDRLAPQVRDITLAIYDRAAKYALERGIIIADTKFEFGQDAEGRLYLIDEVLTPDSSRFWPASEYRPGISPPSFDKQYVRDYLDALDWDKTAPAPNLPSDVIARTAEKYREALRRITGRSTSGG